METYDHMIKILLIGESGVGKTCILHKFNDREFMVNHLATIAIDFKVKYYEVDGVKLKMQIWDTAGQERFHTLTSGFFNCKIKSSSCITDEQSFQRVNSWMDQIKDHAPANVKVVLVGNKCDLSDQRVISKKRGQELADKFNIEFFETSAYDGTNVDSVFEKLGQEVLKNLKEEEEGQQIQPYGQKKGCCQQQINFVYLNFMNQQIIMIGFLTPWYTRLAIETMIFSVPAILLLKNPDFARIPFKKRGTRKRRISYDEYQGEFDESQVSVKEAKEFYSQFNRRLNY